MTLVIIQQSNLVMIRPMQWKKLGNLKYGKAILNFNNLKILLNQYKKVFSF